MQKSFSKVTIQSQPKKEYDVFSKSENESQSPLDYSFEPVLQSGKKVKINCTDLTKIGEKLDVTKDVPLKKPQSAYVLFGNEQRVQIQEKYPGIRVTEVVKMIAKEWQKLTKQQKQKYKEAAKRDKDRFAAELTKLGNSGDDTLLYKIPKKPLTAYMFFVRETRTRVAKEQPEIAPLDIMKVVGRIWQQQTETSLKKYKQMAEEDLERYQKEMHQFIGMLNEMRDNQPLQRPADDVSMHESPTKTSQQSGIQLEAKSPMKNQKCSLMASSYESPLKSEMKMSDIKPMQNSSGRIRPKKPLSAYIFYSQEQRERLKKANPHWSTREVMKQVSDQWAQLQRNQKTSYVEKAWEDKKRFESQIKFLRDFKQPVYQNQPKPSFVRKLDFENFGQNSDRIQDEKKLSEKEIEKKEIQPLLRENDNKNEENFKDFLVDQTKYAFEHPLLENFQPEIFTNNVTPLRPKGNGRSSSPRSYELFYYDPNGHTIPLTPMNLSKKEDTDFDDFFFEETALNIQESTGPIFQKD